MHILLVDIFLSYIKVIATMQNMKFGQAEVAQLTHLAIVSVPKRDSLRLPKQGGKVASRLDNRISFTVEPNTFTQDENITMQVM